MTIPSFRKLVWHHYIEHGRHGLPWRKSHNSYAILVSEIMLQQTQVDRVTGYYQSWMKEYPTVTALANAPLAKVLTSWQGLGYNRRAKLLHEAAKLVATDLKGRMPKTVEGLQALPGVGHYTARAVAAFAFNEDVVFIETNIRTVIIHYFFSNRDTVSDAEITEILTRALPKSQAREWYAALMDYGSYLKRSGIKVHTKAKNYTKQSSFAGSGREVRGAILRSLTQGPATSITLQKLFPKERLEQVEQQLANLLKEGMLEKNGRRYQLFES